MRAIAMIQPPEAIEAFAGGLRDACTDVRVLASAGWMNAENVPDEAVPALLEALRDPEVRVRSNAANAIARLNTIPVEAISQLIECASDPNDGLRRNATTALSRAPSEVVAEIMEHLATDPNLHVRLIAESTLISRAPDLADAGAVLVEAQPGSG